MPQELDFSFSDSTAKTVRASICKIAFKTIPRCGVAALMLLCFVSCSEKTATADGTKIEEAEHVFTSDNNSKFEYDFTEVNTVKITGYTGSFEIHAVTVPATIVYNDQEYTVTEIAEKAFYYANNISSITLPDSITAIGDWAFAGCSYLTSVTIPANVTTIGVGAFHSCVALKDQKLPAALTEIADYTFYSCTALTTLEVPAAITSIGNSAFWGCTELVEVNGMAGVTAIGGYAFNGCAKLSKVAKTDGVQIGEFAFNECPELNK